MVEEIDCKVLWDYASEQRQAVRDDEYAYELPVQTIGVFSFLNKLLISY